MSLLRRSRGSDKPARRPENFRPELLLLLGKDRDLLPGEFEMLVVGPRSLYDSLSAGVVVDKQNLIMLVGCHSEVFGHNPPAQEGRCSLPLKVDLCQPLALFGFQVRADPVAPSLVDGTASRDHVRAQGPSGCRIEAVEKSARSECRVYRPAARRWRQIASIRREFRLPRWQGQGRSFVQHASFDPLRKRRSPRLAGTRQAKRRSTRPKRVCSVREPTHLKIGFIRASLVCRKTSSQIEPKPTCRWSARWACALAPVNARCSPSFRLQPSTSPAGP
jgi:hypothetical protein